ncbi:MAG: superoxide dismutase family protein [Nitrospirae bacterium]|nr:superoxide dismutase family protein [Nitrospirota bacterium]
MMKTFVLIMLCVFLAAGAAYAAELVVPMNMIDANGTGKAIGTVTVSESPYGTIFTPKLSGLAPGLHGFHVHQNADCSMVEKDGHKMSGMAAGGHLDPAGTGKHEGPYGQGHLGDLPALYVDAAGNATLPVLAPRLKTDDLKGRALMIHAGGDNYSDSPAKLGGGGDRVACGVIK